VQWYWGSGYVGWAPLGWYGAVPWAHFVFVQDHCEALDRLIHAPRERVIGAVLNVGTGRHITVAAIAETVRARMNVDVPIKFIGDRPGQVFGHTCDYGRFEDLLGWKPTTSFEQGLDLTIRWYRENESWWRPQMWMRQIPIISASGKRERH
jgi:dTDP-glucose 4,6-dehydratase